MSFIIAAFIFFLGLIIFSFTISNIILIIFFAIPFTKKLEAKNLLKPGSHIISSYLVALTIQIIIIFITTLIFAIFFKDSYFISLLVGYTIGFLSIVLKFKNFGMNLNNFSDYFEKNKTFFWEELTEKYDTNKNDLYNYILKNINNEK